MNFNVGVYLSWEKVYPKIALMWLWRHLIQRWILFRHLQINLRMRGLKISLNRLKDRDVMMSKCKMALHKKSKNRPKRLEATLRCRNRYVMEWKSVTQLYREATCRTIRFRVVLHNLDPERFFHLRRCFPFFERIWLLQLKNTQLETLSYQLFSESRSMYQRRCFTCCLLKP